MENFIWIPFNTSWWLLTNKNFIFFNFETFTFSTNHDFGRIFQLDWLSRRDMISFWWSPRPYHHPETNIRYQGCSQWSWYQVSSISQSLRLGRTTSVLSALLTLYSLYCRVPISAQENPPKFFQRPHCWVYCIFRSIRKSIFLVSFADLSRSLFFRNHAARNLSKVLFCSIRAVLADKKSPPDPYLSKEEKFYFQKLSSLDTSCRPIIYWFS